ncbi:glycoside hydrolase superfamily [Daedaleopsis nitida]|nr:glycoside hydrolase superfamily [Daedaleopsis nitida]
MSYQPVPANADGHGAHTPDIQHLQLQNSDNLPSPMMSPRFAGLEGSDIRASLVSSQPTIQEEEPNSSTAALGLNGRQGSNLRDSYVDSDLNEKSPRSYPTQARSRKKAIIIGAVVAVLVIVGVVLGVYFGVVKPKQNDKNNTAGNVAIGDGSSSGDTSQADGGDPDDGPKSGFVVTGGDGSTVTLEDGSTFTYTNSFGGSWYYDPENPFVSSARSQSWTPAINETFKFGQDLIRGVNLGGWLVLEPAFLSAPALFEKYSNSSDPAVDEWDVSERLTADTAGGGLDQLEEHYKTFITEKDFAEIAAAGLNFVRLPIGYWAIEVRENEPFLPRTSWKYFLKAVEWARKYGIRIKLDLHALPGSQNGWNHSSRLGKINMLYGPMGLANAQRSLDYIRVIAEFISQPEYSDVVVMFGIVNEPYGPTIGRDSIKRFYVEAYNVVRTASGIGEGKGPWMLDTHHYLCFGDQSASGYAARISSTQPCGAWASGQNTSMRAFGMTHVGEWSLGINDCGLFLNGVNLGARFDGSFSSSHFGKTGDCTPYTDYTTYDDKQKEAMKEFALQSMSALQNWFFWTWKIGPSSVSGRPESPAWSYQLGLQEGWMPTDPRAAAGKCEASDPYTSTLSAWQTGGEGAGNVPQTFLDEWSWPPATLTNTAYPQYTQTGSLVTLPGPEATATGTGVRTVDGWNNPSDTALMYVPVATCGYLDPWMGPDSNPDACPGTNARRGYAPRAVITPAPARR